MTKECEFCGKRLDTEKMIELEGKEADEVGVMRTRYSCKHCMYGISEDEDS